MGGALDVNKFKNKPGKKAGKKPPKADAGESTPAPVSDTPTQVSDIQKELADMEATEVQKTLQFEMTNLRDQYDIKATTNVALIEKLNDALKLASIDFDLSQKELTNIAVNRLLQDLRKHSFILDSKLK